MPAHPCPTPPAGVSRRAAGLALAAGLGGWWPAGLHAQDAAAGRYQRVPASPDGIGKAYMGREIAGVMGWQGAGWLERVEREREEGAGQLLRELGLAPGLQVADVGAGTGWHARRIAPRILPGGVVWASDVQPQMLQLLQQLARREGIDNIRPVEAGPQDARLPAGGIDLALLVDVYHELEHPYEVMASVVRALRPDGRLALVEYRAGDPQVPIKPLHTMTEPQVLREMAAHPQLAHARTVRLPWQHLVLFTRKEG